jgi:hypothetical protein
LNTTQKKIFIATISYTLVWNTRYFWEYLPGLFDLGIFLLLFATIFTLGAVAVFQVYKFITEHPKNNIRLINIGLIVLAMALTHAKPSGLIDFEKYEGENTLLAKREGAANCTTSFRLKEGGRFKKTIICFGADHYWGNYEIVGDTIKFRYNRISEENKEGDYGILTLGKGYPNKPLGILSFYSEGSAKGGIPFFVKELDKWKLGLD